TPEEQPVADVAASHHSTTLHDPPAPHIAVPSPPNPHPESPLHHDALESSHDPQLRNRPLPQPPPSHEVHFNVLSAQNSSITPQSHEPGAALGQEPATAFHDIPGRPPIRHSDHPEQVFVEEPEGGHHGERYPPPRPSFQTPNGVRNGGTNERSWIVPETPAERSNANVDKVRSPMYQGSSRSKLTRAHIFYRYILLVHSFTNSITSFQFQSQGPVQPLSVEERLQPTLDTALQHQKQYSTQATAYAVVLNVCISLQILLGAMITALAAVASKHAGATTAVLGACSTLVATYLAKARSGGEPESSRRRSTE
ncbi:hypothetical protein SISNIDRAFT_293614, partial [Sistotremastrum niveocremeum HHB9708]